MLPFYANLEDIKGFFLFSKPFFNLLLSKEEEILSNSARKTELIKILIQTLENLGYE